MGFNTKDADAERRARFQARLEKPGRRKDLKQYLARKVWPLVPPGELGRVLSREEEDRIPGHGPEGY